MIRLISVFLTALAISVSAQKTKFFAGAAYGVVNYQFKDDSEAFVGIKTPGIPAFGVQTSVQLALSESFRIGTGLNYLMISGKSSPVFIDSRLINPNATGDYTLEVNSSYFQIPVEFILILNKSWKLKPFLSGGLSFFIPLKTRFLARMDPVNPSTAYSKMDAEIDESNELGGGTIGTGFLIPLINDREIIFRLNYRINSMGYQYATQALTEKRALKFNIIEVSAGVSLF